MERFTINFEDITDEKTKFSFRVGQKPEQMFGRNSKCRRTLQIIDNLRRLKNESDIKKTNQKVIFGRVLLPTLKIFEIFKKKKKKKKAFFIHRKKVGLRVVAF